MANMVRNDSFSTKKVNEHKRAKTTQRDTYLFFSEFVQLLLNSLIRFDKVIVAFFKILEPGLLLGILELFCENPILFF